ncbi:hypothetical protein [Cystobacter ferrugineus]|uniref:Uncharacterized protein n=1 Tax=Cystobacter ferrugineus TaxID=83449 RepID=A0A1L9B1V2_9BACT|nr:hypothetical protein [Cystobacter ferrugineus]OJH36220.1 hypothetical protein BON30_34235 [Cystobacter ferrugineus]
MNGTTLRLPSHRAVDVVPGPALTTLPGWTLDALNVGPFRSARGYDAHLARTLGSTFDWGDEFRFGDDTLLLETLILKVPERNLDRGELVAWMESPVAPGLLRLRERESFLFDGTTARHLALDGSALLCYFEELAPTQRRYRINVAPSLDLLCDDGRYYGWMLAWPVRHLIPDTMGGPSSPSRLEDDARLVPLVLEYHQLVSDDTLDRLNARDPTLKAALTSLRERTSPPETLSRRALRERIDALFDTFY